MIDHSTKQCSRCRGTFPVLFFRKEKFGRYTRRAVCIGCEQTERDQIKQRNRFRDKARNCIRKHAERIGQKWGCLRAAFSERYGWNIDNIEHDLRHAWENGCPTCRQPFKSMPHGLADMTLDVIDPNTEPFYQTNVRIQCRTCNTAKGDKRPDEWAVLRIAWAQWEDWQAKLARDQWTGTMFEGVGFITV